MKHTVFPFLLMLPAFLWGQYIPTLKECHEWTLGEALGMGLVYYDTYSLGEPVLIRDTLYYPHGYGYVREDTLEQRVYHRQDSIESERIFVDYGVEVGDTLWHETYEWPQGTINYVTVDTIDTVMWYGRMRRRFVMPNVRGLYYIYWEGIGKFTGVRDYASAVFLADFREDGPPCTSTDIQLPASVPQPTVYPTLFSHSLTLSVPLGPAQRFELRDLAGRMCWQGEVGKESLIINTEMLPMGLYFVRFENGTPIKVIKDSY